jgi:CRISPR-associated protein Csb2
VLDRLRFLEADGRRWQLVLEGIGDRDWFRSALLASATEWVSATPYLHPWHRKPRFDVRDQIRRECGERGLPDVADLEPVAEIRVGERVRRPIHFHRFRSKRGLTQPDRHGSFWRLRFAEPVRGPLALGFACHFGLGLFEPLGADMASRRRGGERAIVNFVEHEESVAVSFENAAGSGQHGGTRT